MLEAGYTKVSVVRGGWQQLIEAGIAVAPKAPHVPALPEAALPEQAESAVPAERTMPSVPTVRESA